MVLPNKVIVIESRTNNDKSNGRTEQNVLGAIFLQLGIKAKIVEVNTPAAFYRALRQAESDHINYVHFSGHGYPDGVAIGDRLVTWEDIDANCWPHLKGVCLSFSSCDVAKGVKQLFSKHKTFCAAAVSATRPISWPEGAVAFASFFLRATDEGASTEQDVRVMNHICGRGTFKVVRAQVANSTYVLV